MTPETDRTKRSELSRYDSAILDFAESWAPFGGGHEHVLVEFGLGLGEYNRRLQRIMAQVAADGL